jgi:hypothetical protein
MTITEAVFGDVDYKISTVTYRDMKTGRVIDI